MKLTVTMRVQGTSVEISCPQIDYTTTVNNCLIVDDTYAAIIDLGRTWEEIGPEIQAQLPTCREVVPFMVPITDHERLMLFVQFYLVEIQERYRPHRWWHVVYWLPDHLLLEWPDYDRLSQRDREIISSNLRWLQLRQVNGHPPPPGRRTPADWTNLALLVMLVGIIVFYLLTQ